MSDNKNVPEIRFHGFTDSWEDSCLAQNVDVRSGRDYKHLLKGNIPVFGTGGYMLSVNEALSYNEDAVGIGRKGTIDKPFILQAPFWTVDTLFYAVPKSTNDLQFIYDVFQKINWKEKDESTGVPSLSKVAINGIQMFSTSLPEQQKIGSYFQNLDKLITQHQNKHNQLVNLKKMMLEKMLPKEGTVLPEVRFKGFDEAWKEISITKIGASFIGLVTSMTKYYQNDGVLLIRNSDIKENHFKFSEAPIFLDEQFAKDNASRKLKMGDVVTVHTGDVGTSAVITKNEEGAIGFATINTRPKKEIVDSNYLSTFFNSNIHKSFAVRMSTGDGRANYNLGDFFKLVLPLPEIKEQQKIGAYFQNLDKLIALQKQQLEKLKNIKKACLDKMFV